MATDETMQTSILLLSGSLRAGSVNTALLTTAKSLAPAGTRVELHAGMADLPHFNPDDDREPLPDAVARLRAQVRMSEAVLISTPEYAGGLPGSFKNLLDWTIGGTDGESLYGVPVGWINPSAHGGAEETCRSLKIVLTKAGADIVEAACRNSPVARESAGPDGQIEDARVRAVLSEAMAALLNHIHRHPRVR